MKTIQKFLSRNYRWRALAIGGLVGLLYLIPFVVIPGFSAGYIKIGDIKGEATAPGYEDWIEIDSLQFGLGRPISSPTGSQQRQVGAPSISEIVITKSIDKSSPILMREAAFGETQQDVQVHFTEVGPAGTENVYLAVTLSDVLVSSFATSGSSDDTRPTESISLNFTKIKMDYTPMVAGKQGTPVSAEVDLAQPTP